MVEPAHVTMPLKGTESFESEAPGDWVGLERLYRSSGL
jgi:hypothetical protein